jgi:Na+/H+-translocating membrane pyrophosphatase
MIIRKIPVRSGGVPGESASLISSGDDEVTTKRLQEIYEAIYEGAESFLAAEYRVCFWFVSVFSIVILVLVAWGTGWDMARGLFTSISFLLGAFTSMASGYLGMKVAVYSNVRTTVSAQQSGWTACFNTAFRAGAVMGKNCLQTVSRNYFVLDQALTTTFSHSFRVRFRPLWVGYVDALLYHARLQDALPRPC